MDAPVSPGETFLMQIQRLEEKLRRAQDGGPLPDAGVTLDTAEEASNMRREVQRSIIAKSQTVARENDELSKRVAHLDRSLRASEAARKHESRFSAHELHGMRQQLDSERVERQEWQPRRSEVEEEGGAETGGSSSSLRTREWRLRAELAEATHEAASARTTAVAQAEEHQRVSADLAARAASATQGVLRLQEEVKASLSERESLVSQLKASRQEADAMRNEAEAAVRDRAAAAEAIASSTVVAEAARAEAEEARRQATAAVRAEEKEREEKDRAIAESVSDATRKAAGAIAAAQAQAALTVQRVTDAVTQRDAELQEEARAAAATASNAAAEAAEWQMRCSQHEAEVTEMRKSIAAFKLTSFPCTADQMRDLCERAFGTELRDVEREVSGCVAAIRVAEAENERLRARSEVAEAIAEEAQQVAADRIIAANREAAAVQTALADSVAVAEAACASEVALSARRLEAAGEARDAAVGAERALREQGDEEIIRLNGVVNDHRDEILAAQNAMRDAQRAALAMGMTAKKVARAAQADGEQRAMRETTFEAEQLQWKALETQLRASHSEAVAHAEHERLLRLGAESDALRMEESGVLAAVQAEEERVAKSSAVQKVLELGLETRSCEARLAIATEELREADHAYHQIAQSSSHEIAELKQEIVELRLERRAAAEKAVAGAADARVVATREAAVAAAHAANALETNVRRELHAAGAAQEAVRLASAEHERRATLTEQAQTVAAMQTSYESEIFEFERKLVSAHIGAAGVSEALTQLESAVQGDSERDMNEASKLGDELRQREGLIDRLKRESLEATERANAAETLAEKKVRNAIAEAEEEMQAELEAAKAAAAANAKRAEEAEAKATLESEAAIGQMALHAHAIQRLDAEKKALEEKLAGVEEAHRKELSILEERANADRDARARYEEEGMGNQAKAQQEAERLEAELEQERERRQILQGVHDREMGALKTALQKATGFKEKAPADSAAKEKSSATGRTTSAAKAKA